MKNPQRLILFCLFFAGFYLSNLQASQANQVVPPMARDGYEIVTGEWQRTDGNYLITIKDIQADGQATVEYFNPKPINIEQAKISTQKGLIKIFIRFQDKGYEGSTYTLYYYAQEKALVGFYYQAAMNKTFEVIFLKKAK